MVIFFVFIADGIILDLLKLSYQNPIIYTECYFLNLQFLFLYLKMKNYSLSLLLIVALLHSATSQNARQPPVYIEGCAQYDSNQLCGACEFGYSKQNQTCVSNNQSGDCCAAYDIYGACSKCASGLYFTDPYCIRNSIYGCVNKKDNQCLECGKGLALSNGICFTVIQNCNNYSTSGQCTSCLNGFTLRNAYCVELPQVENCKIQTINGCAQCLQGFYLTADQKCNGNQFGCLKYWKEQCLACIAPFELLNGTCAILGCVSFDGRGCRQCQTGLTLQDGLCLWNNCLKFANGVCFECSKDFRLTSQGCVLAKAFQCQSCPAGFIFVNNRCTKIIPGCNTYNANGLCASCRTNFELTVNGGCQILGCSHYHENGCAQCVSPFELANGICVIQFCLKYSGSGCSQCQQNYVLSNNRCIITDTSCAKYNQNGVCIQCIDTHFLSNGICVKGDRGCVYPQGKCQCRPNFYVNQQGKCQILGCNQYNANDDCTACFQPFTFDSSKQLCIITQCVDYILTGCKQCSSGFTVSNGRCITEVPFCSGYSSSGVCTSCRSGYRLDTQTKQCLRQISNCQELNADRVSCKKCRKGFVLFKGQCRDNIPNCRSYNLNAFECTECENNFVLRQKQCVPRDPFCTRYEKQGLSDVCLTCAAGYLLQNDGICLKTIPGCIYQGSRCARCKSPFLYNAKKSSCYINGCQQYNENGCASCIAPFESNNGNCVIKFCQEYDISCCLTCLNGYRLLEGTCVAIDENCLQFKANNCVRCRNGYININGKCVIGDENCLNYGDSGSCIKCKDNFFLNRQKRCIIRQVGCVYERDVCRSCVSPFKFNSAKRSCQIDNCAEINQSGCLKCQSPFVLSNNKDCLIPNCLNVQNQCCVQCNVGYHIKNNLYCEQDDLNCLSYDANGNCQVCAKGLTLNSNGQCSKLDSVCLKVSSDDKSRCLECANDYFLNRYYQCQKISKGCIEYTNGVCSKCANRFFLFQEICFPYTKGCVKYSGKDCTECRIDYVLKNGQCFGWNKKDLSLIGGDDNYDFAINPIDVRQSKYYINNLSPASELGKYYFSSSFDSSYETPALTGQNEVIGKGWKSKLADQNQFIGILITDQPVTFYAVQIEAVEGNSIQEFQLEYSVNGVDFISVQNTFTVDQSVVNNIVTIYFTGIYAKSLRIKIIKYRGWPAARIDFFYYDLIRFRKISNLKSLKYLQETISSNYVDRVDNQLYINQAYFFNPVASCTSNELCFTGLQLCQKKKINELVLSFQDGGSVSEFYLTYTIDGRSYNCFNSCAKIAIHAGKNFKYNLKGFQAQGIRIYPTKYQGTPKFSPTFFYE